MKRAPPSASSPAAFAHAKQLFFKRDYAAADRAFRALLKQYPEHPDALHYLGVLAYLEHRYEEAIRLIRKALPRRREDSELHSNLALALQAAGAYDEAIAAMRRAIHIVPTAGEYHATLATLWRDLGQLDFALTETERALKLKPGLPLAHYNRAVCRLLAGRYDDIWRDYQYRIASDFGTPYTRNPYHPERFLPLPASWCENDLSDKRVLVLSDQGIGDELFFLRFAPAVRLRCAWLGYRASPKVASLLCDVPSLDWIGTELPNPAEVDHLLLVSDLPLLAPTSSTPPSLALRMTDHTVDVARERLQLAGAPPYLALTWRAGPEPKHGDRPGRRKAIALASLVPAIARWPGTYLSLQRSPGKNEIADLSRLLGRPVADFGPINDDLSSLLGLLACVDNYLGVSNTNMHLRIGLGLSAAVLVTSPPDWRWLEHSTSSPWFPSFRLYREHRIQGWTPALAKLATDLDIEKQIKTEKTGI
jgi:Tetratricopeptide repeat